MIEDKQKQDKENSLERSRRKKSVNTLETVATKEKPRIVSQLTREETKKKGNSYLKDLVTFNKQRRRRSNV